MPLRKFLPVEIEPDAGIFLLAPLSLNHTKSLFDFLRKNASDFEGPFPVTVQQAGKNENDCGRWIRQRLDMQQDGLGLVLLLLTPGGEVIGFLSAFNFDWRVPKCELAWMVDKDYEGKGIMKKGIETFIQFLFEACLLEKIICRTEPYNVRSNKLAEKLGFKQEGLHAADFRNGHNKLVDVQYWGLLKNKKGYPVSG